MRTMQSALWTRRELADCLVPRPTCEHWRWGGPAWGAESVSHALQPRLPGLQPAHLRIAMAMGWRHRYAPPSSSDVARAPAPVTAVPGSTAHTPSAHAHARTPLSGVPPPAPVKAVSAAPVTGFTTPPIAPVQTAPLAPLLQVPTVTLYNPQPKLPLCLYSIDQFRSS